MKISILLPTRKRPENVRRLWDSLVRTTSDMKRIEVVAYIDDDDASYDGLDLPIVVLRGPRIVLSEMWNRCAERATGEILMHGGDDIIFRTAGWDDVVRRAFEKYPDRIVFVYGRDGCPSTHGGRTFGTHGFLHRRWVDTVGHFVPPYFSCDYNDTWLNDVARALGRHHLVDIETEHMHPNFGKAAMDETHTDRLERGARDRVDVLYEITAPQRAEDIGKLRAVINGAGC